jgi:hypothetical protein
MSLTFVSTKMIEQPVQFDTLSANNFTAVNSYLTSVDINLANTNNLQANTGAINNLYVQNLTADYFVEIVNSNIVFTVEDNSKAYHFDTSVGPLCAIFPKDLPIGFNVSIYNIGNFYIELSSNGVFNTPGNNLENNTRNTGMFIYKAPDPTGLPVEGVFYGVGVFE